MVKRVQKKERLIYRLTTLLIFLVSLNLLAVPLYIILYADLSFMPLQSFNAKMVSTTLNVLGYNADSADSTVNLISGDTIQKIGISWDSTGWKSMYAIASLILVTPISTIRHRIKVAFVAVAIVFFINYLRIATTILISINFGFNFFDIVHTVLWREGLILAVVGIWFGWMRMEKYKIGKIK